MRKILILTLFNLNMVCSSGGTLNTAFNSGGTRPGTFSTFITSDSATTCQCLALAETPSGKIISAGRATIGALTQAALVQLSSNGSLDTTFNSSGSKPGTYSAVLAGNVTSPTITSSTFNAVAIQSDGKIVAAGTSVGSAITYLLVARFNSDGSLDASFGTSGSAVITINNITGYSAKSIVPLSGGKILVSASRPGSPITIGLARFNSNGTLDTTFNSSGEQPGTYVLPAISGVPLSGSSSGTLVVDSDGKYILGSTCMVSGINRPIVIRLGTDLMLDTTFNSTGYNYFNFDETGSGSAVLGVQLQSDGKIIVFGSAGFGTPATTTKACVGRLNTDGSLDTSFDSIGSTSFLYGSSDATSTLSTVQALGFVESGKFIVCGRSSFGTSPSVSNMGIARFNSNGTLDTTFNSSGFVPGTNATTINSGAVSSVCFSGTLFGSSDFICGGTVASTNQAAFADFKTDSSVSTPDLATFL